MGCLCLAAQTYLSAGTLGEGLGGLEDDASGDDGRRYRRGVLRGYISMPL
jgi:hypothetical protein